MANEYPIDFMTGQLILFQLQLGTLSTIQQNDFILELQKLCRLIPAMRWRGAIRT
jgi:hypothetical protein